MRLIMVSVTLREPGTPAIVRLSFDGDAGNEANVSRGGDPGTLHETLMPEAAARALVRRLRGDADAPALGLTCYLRVETIGEWLDGSDARAVEIAQSVQDPGLGEERG